jgi:uncharacterized membrane protein HdeD (DUF308 family)
MIGMFVDPTSLLVISIPLFAACITMPFGAGVHWSVILKDLGVPLGLLMSFLGFYGMLQNANDPLFIGPATSIMLLTSLYGGTLASFGYFWRFRSKSSSNHEKVCQDVQWWAPSISIAVFLATTTWVMEQAAELGAFFMTLPLSVSVITSAIALIFSNKNHLVKAISQSFLLSAMLNVLIGLIVYFQGDELSGNHLGLAIAILGISYSLIFYICFYFLSYKHEAQEQIEPTLMNWHWLEVSGLIIFMFLAPETIRESMINTEANSTEEAMQLRIEELERKLEAISKVEQQ